MAYDLYFQDPKPLLKLIQAGVCTRRDFAEEIRDRASDRIDSKVARKLEQFGVTKCKLRLVDGYTLTFESEEQATVFVLQWM